MSSCKFHTAVLATKPVLFSVLALSLSSSSFAEALLDSSPDTFVITATRTAQERKDVLSDNVIISADEIAQSGQSSLVELLQRQRGIEISRTGGAGAAASVFIRGASNAQSIVLVDGVRVGSATLGGATWATIPLSQIDHIEIVYGPMSSIYGADAMGGVVQIFTKKGDGAPTFTLSTGYGSYATESTQAAFSGSLGDEHRFGYAVRAAHEAADGFSATNINNKYSYNGDNDGFRKDSTSGQFSYALAKGHELGLSFLQSQLNAQYDNGAKAYDPRNIQELENYAVYAKDSFLPNWNSKLQLAKSIDKSGTDNGVAGSQRSHIDTTQNQVSWQNDIAIANDNLQFLFEQREENVGSNSTLELARKRTTNSVSTMYQLKRDANLATLSLRNDDSTQYGSHTTGSIGYGYHLSDALRVNASYGTSFRAPSFNELYYPGYGFNANKPEQGKNTEAGIYYETKLTQLSATYYHNRISDLLVYAETCPKDVENHPYGCAYNVDEALLEGITLGGSRQLGDFTLRGSVDIQDPQNLTTHKVLSRNSKRHGTLALEYTTGNFTTGTDMTFSGKRFDDTDNIDVLAGYTLVNLYASYNFTRDLSLSGRWNNVLDTKYELNRGYNTPESNVFIRLSYTLR